jgi:hypothetical protein
MKHDRKRIPTKYNKEHSKIISQNRIVKVSKPKLWRKFFYCENIWLVSANILSYSKSDCIT